MSFIPFGDVQGVLRCPLCQEGLHREGNSLCCAHRHTFDLSKQGACNLIPNMKASKEYDKENFVYRNQVLEAGFYDNILEGIANRMPKEGRVLDVACGEGFYARALADIQESLSIYAFDLSKHSIQLAAKKDRNKKISWLVADLANLPFEDQSIDVILDIYSPANYGEFKRVLKPGGLLIKVVPHPNHVKELRALLPDEKREAYSNQTLLDLFSEHFTVVEQVTIQQTSPVTKEQRQAFIEMSPVLFHAKKENLPQESIEAVTVAGTLLLGRR
ncbi:methyltransferase domain-containing protein [Streptococcus sp. DD13]|uniref:methyltransferase domain-containing protein n=1 Tax=Streptococcus sp. DD13 TaxID=1777881 RepID=UPI0007951DB6|nr:methyltransferase domain-containing protein [Streptococcus sp. DD13]KXT77817.1 Ribosomal RNA large subunit methyltransferase A [Streptococcus sp. DD13]